jgi:ureidoglycolate lyase
MQVLFHRKRCSEEEESMIALRRLRRALSPFEFTPESIRDPKLRSNLRVLDVPCVPATEQSLQGFGHLISSADERTVERGNFEIVQWPQPGWRPLDPQTGDEAGTTEGEFDVLWHGDHFFGHNRAVATKNNFYLDGLGAIPERASRTPPATGDGSAIYLWMSDYHPDGAQLFFPLVPTPFTVCLGLSRHGDNVRPQDMRAFRIPEGKGVYIHPSTWHNGVYVPPDRAPATFVTRQGRVHARVSASWAAEFDTLLRVPLR